MKAKQIIAAIVVAILGGSVAVAEVIPPRTWDKKRVVIRNIRHCKPGHSILVGRGAFDPDKQKHPEYVCRSRDQLNGKEAP